MPYDNGERVSQEEFIRRKHEREGTEPQQFHTGPSGENPASAPEIDPETNAPKVKKKAGSQRSKRSEKSAKAAVADALGVKADSPALDDIDVTGLDAEPESKEDE